MDSGFIFRVTSADTITGTGEGESGGEAVVHGPDPSTTARQCTTTPYGTMNTTIGRRDEAGMAMATTISCRITYRATSITTTSITSIRTRGITTSHWLRDGGEACRQVAKGSAWGKSADDAIAGASHC